MLQSVCLSVCLSHAPKAKLVQFRAMVTIEHYETPCCKSNPLVSLSPKTGGSISFRRRWGDIALFSPPGYGPQAILLLFLIYLFLMIPARLVISKSTGPIFTKFSGLKVICLQMTNLKLVFRLYMGSCHGNRILLF